MKLFNRNFLFLIGSQLFSVFGATIAQFAISLYVLDKTGSMSVFSIVLSLSMLSKVIFLPFGGIIADRLPKRNLMIVMDFIYLVLSLGLAYSVLNDNTIFIMGVISIVLGIVSSFETPVVQSAIPLVCTKENIPQSNGVINSIAMLSNILAPVIAGIVYNFEKAYIVFIVSSILFFIAVLCEIFLVIGYEKKSKKKESAIGIVKNDFKEVVIYFKSNTIIVKICTVTFLLNLFISAFINTVIPYTVRVDWKVSNGDFGIMNMLLALGGLVGSILVTTIASRLKGIKMTRLLLLNSLLFALLAVPYSNNFSNKLSFWITTILITFIIMLFTMVSVQLISFVQMLTSSDILGRVMSFIIMLSTLAMPLGQIIYGFLGRYILGRNAVIIISIVATIFIMISIYSNGIFKEVHIDEKNEIGEY